MLSKILSKETCAGCKFCCSFRRCSLWETPLFPEDTVKKLGGKFDMEQKDGYSYGKMNFDGRYSTDDSEEEAACQYLDAKKGCVLSYEDKPFDCKIWPLRIMRVQNQREDKPESGGDGRTAGKSKLVVALTPTCPAINKVDIETVRKLVKEELGSVIYEYAGKHPYIIKEYREGFPVLAEYDDF